MGGPQGRAQLVDGRCQFDEGERLKRARQPPDRESWNRQMYRMRVFTQLVADTDRNVGNVLIRRDWKLWMIDFTRAFRRMTTLMAPGDLTRCDRALLERLRALTKDTVTAATQSVHLDTRNRRGAGETRSNRSASLKSRRRARRIPVLY